MTLEQIRRPSIPFDLHSSGVHCSAGLTVSAAVDARRLLFCADFAFLRDYWSQAAERPRAFRRVAGILHWGELSEESAGHRANPNAVNGRHI